MASSQLLGDATRLALANGAQDRWHRVERRSESFVEGAVGVKQERGSDVEERQLGSVPGEVRELRIRGCSADIDRSDACVAHGEHDRVILLRFGLLENRLDQLGFGQDWLNQIRHPATSIVFE